MRLFVSSEKIPSIPLGDTENRPRLPKTLALCSLVAAPLEGAEKDSFLTVEM